MVIFQKNALSGFYQNWDYPIQTKFIEENAK